MTVKLKCVVRHVKKDWEPILVGAAWIVAALVVAVVVALIGWALRVQLVTVASLAVTGILLVLSHWYLVADVAIVYFLTLHIALFATKKDLMSPKPTPEGDVWGKVTPVEMEDDSPWFMVFGGSGVSFICSALISFIAVGSTEMALWSTLVVIIILVIANPEQAAKRRKDHIILCGYRGEDGY